MIGHKIRPKAQLTEPSNPLGEADLRLWLSAEFNVSVAGGSVATWGDLSGNASGVAQSVAGSKPVDTATINSRHAIHFAAAGTQDFLNNSNVAALAPTAGVTLVMVARFTDLTAAIQFFGGRGDTGNHGYYMGRVNDGLSFHVGNGADNDAAKDVTEPAVNVPYIYTGKWDGTNIFIRRDGVQRAQKGFAGSLDYTLTPDFALGQITDYTVGRALTGDIAEVFVFGTALSNANCLLLEQYLGAKYAITVP